MVLQAYFEYLFFGTKGEMEWNKSAVLCRETPWYRANFVLFRKIFGLPAMFIRALSIYFQIFFESYS